MCLVAPFALAEDNNEAAPSRHLRSTFQTIEEYVVFNWWTSQLEELLVTAGLAPNGT